MEEALKILSIIGASSIKFVAGPLLAHTYNFNYLESITLTVIGGMCGVIVISFFSTQVLKIYKWFRHNKIYRIHKSKRVYLNPVIDKTPRLSKSASALLLPRENKRILLTSTSTNRKVVKYWKKFGLTGVALITPIFISIPLGTFIATKYVRNRKKVLLYMFFSIVFWAVVFSSILQLFNNNL